MAGSWWRVFPRTTITGGAWNHTPPVNSNAGRKPTDLVLLFLPMPVVTSTATCNTKNAQKSTNKAAGSFFLQIGDMFFSAKSSSSPPVFLFFFFADKGETTCGHNQTNTQTQHKNRITSLSPVLSSRRSVPLLKIAGLSLFSSVGWWLEAA